MGSALLLSGGMDSISLAWWKRPRFAFTVDYGQLAAEAEIAASTAIARQLDLQHHVLTINARALGSGDMAGASPDALAPESDWWPYRNQLLITAVAMKAVARGATELLLGTVASDGTHRDGTKEFVDKVDALMACQEGGLRVRAPAIGLNTAELVRTAGIPLNMLAWAHSCHKASVPCGQCRGCNKHLEVLQELTADNPANA
ncbi:MAG TPA: 7-cyano-7-deazaguanine synthase [Rhodanobacteraceae bacterium]|nr:7-cyano-7-deazaguanine synthase [Rhodanobacteraceae bacterium]